MTKTTAIIVGSGNIGTDLMYKLLRSDTIELEGVVGVDPTSEGLKRARSAGVDISHEGVDWIFNRTHMPDIVFEATSAYVHVRNAPRYKEAGIVAIDLTPAARGPFVVPPVNLDQHLGATNVNMVTCGGQATIPMVHAVARITPVSYAEIVATVASASAGPGTRQNIDEFTRTTSRAIEQVGGASAGKAIIILNPAEPPLIMRDTIYCAIGSDSDEEAISKSIVTMAADVASYVPGYRLLADPQFDSIDGDRRVAIFVEVEGAGDFLPTYSGNLDIMTAAAVKVGEQIGTLAVGASK